MSGRINVLDKMVSERIAAGEVVDSASSVVKELVENSMDAGATNISVDIERGGKTLIRVTDDGEGIQRDDVPRAFLRHATSKINSARDLERLSTLGFRGEALASIAAVSFVCMTTRTKTSMEGIQYSICGGKQTEYKEIGCSEGTCVEVRELFYNTPARREFLKADSYEASLVSDMLTRLSLARPDISFKLTHNGRRLLDTPGNGKLRDAIVAVYGKDTLDNLLGIKCRYHGIGIRGVISKPHQTRPNRNFQSFFVNGRYVKSKMLIRTLERAYKTLLMVNRHPMAVLYITVDTELIDINVHPAKLEIRFLQEDEIKSALYNCISTNLESRRWIAPGLKRADGPAMPLAAKGRIAPSDVANTNVPLREKQISHLSEETGEYNRIEMDNIIEGGSQRIPEMKLIGQFMSTFLLAEGQECVYIIDQHAAHERIMYERLTDDVNKGAAASQQLLEPIVIDMSALEMEVIRNHWAQLSAMGFQMDEFGFNSIALRAVPIYFGAPQSAEFLRDLANQLSTQKSTVKDGLKQQEIIKRACKSAVKANQRLSEREMQDLLEQLKSTKMPFCCPHGRPVFVSLTRYQLEKMFKRIV